MAIKDGKFLKVGTAEEVNAARGKNTRVVDLEGKFVMHGFIDAHNHATGASMGRANTRI